MQEDRWNLLYVFSRVSANEINVVFSLIISMNLQKFSFGLHLIVLFKQATSFLALSLGVPDSMTW